MQPSSLNVSVPETSPDLSAVAKSLLVCRDRPWDGEGKSASSASSGPSKRRPALHKLHVAGQMVRTRLESCGEFEEVHRLMLPLLPKVVAPAHVLPSHRSKG